MIKIESVTIREIRGIRDLTIEPSRENFLVLGPNGSGKSGVVDAIQVALTGGMSRIAGRGTAGLSLRRHGPHVDSHDNPGCRESLASFVRTGIAKVGRTYKKRKVAGEFSLRTQRP